ncbi:MAG: ABC transporter permease, partial [Bacteroidota bacterium]
KLLKEYSEALIIALVLATCTLIVYKQLNYVKNKNLGFNKEHVLMFILRGNEIREKMDVFKHRLDQIPQVENYTFSLDRPGIRTSWFGNYKFEGDGEAEHPAFPAVSIDERFFETFGMQLMEGRNFSVDMASDSGAMIVNEAMVKYLGWEDPIGKSVYEMAADYDRERFQVIGVVKDFHMESLHKSIEPVIFKFERMQPRWCFIRLRPGDPSETIQAVEEAWSDVVPGREISTYFLNAAYDSEYRSEQQFGKIFIYFTLFALFIAGLGIVGLVSYITASRTREIGIRKVMGAGTTTILRMLSMDFVKMIAVALVISIPVSYLIMDKWLERFAYTTLLSFWIFLLSGFIAFLVALLSTAVQTIRAASQNPADTIRYE